LRLVVLMGGSSSEREVSLRSGRAVAKALRELGHEVYELEPDGRLCKRIEELKPDKVFIALHGRPGEDGTVQGALELMGVPYTGSDAVTSALCIDKDFTKAVALKLGVKTPRWEVFTPDRRPVWERFPAVVKPAREGSSLGLKVVGGPEELKKALDELLKTRDKVLVEEFIEGSDYTVGLLKGKPLPVIRVEPKKGLYDYESKYTKGLTEYFFEEGELARRLQELALKLWEALGLRDFARIDFRVSPEGEPYFLEVNTIPGLTETSLLPMAAAKAGIDFKKLIDIIIS